MHLKIISPIEINKKKALNKYRIWNCRDTTTYIFTAACKILHEENKIKRANLAYKEIVFYEAPRR